MTRRFLGPHHRPRWEPWKYPPRPHLWAQAHGLRPLPREDTRWEHEYMRAQPNEQALPVKARVVEDRVKECPRCGSDDQPIENRYCDCCGDLLRRD